MRVVGVGVELVAVGAAQGEDAAFTERELAQARGRSHPEEFLAGRRAIKRAVLKAAGLGGSLSERDVECLDDKAGAPRVSHEGRLATAFAAAGISEVLVSLSNEGGLVAALAVAQG